MRKEFGHNIAFKFEDSADNCSKTKNRTVVTKNRTGVIDDGVKSKPQGNSGSQDTGLLTPLETHGSKVNAAYDSLSDEEDGKPSLVASALLNSMKSGPPSSEVPKTKKPNGVKKMAPVGCGPLFWGVVETAVSGVYKAWTSWNHLARPLFSSV